MIEKIIKKEDFITTSWSGGATTQLLIYPENAEFSNKDFLFRISSATFTSTESTFSNFRNYQRYILPLEGMLSVRHDKLYFRNLEKFEVEYFDGAWTTYSENTLDCRDYNFIYRKGSYAAMKILGEKDLMEVDSNSVITLFSTQDSSFCINEKDYSLTGFSLLLIDTEEDRLEIEIKELESPIIATVFTK